ncbi:MAG: class I SAM-dependent methyltransferase [Candidatus Binatia bacterium]
MRVCLWFLRIEKLPEERVVMICPVCQSEARRLFSQHDYWIYECRGCQHRCAGVPDPDQHVARVYGDAYFSGGGAGYSNYLGERSLLIEHGRRYGELLARYTARGRLLDVAAAAGFILRGLCECGWDGEGIEPNVCMAAYARSHVQVQVYPTTFEEFRSTESYDVVTMIQVIAHFLDPRVAMEKAKQLLRPGGHLLIETWNRGSWTARLFGYRWHEYNPPSVVQWFTPEGLSHLASQYTFREIARGRPVKRLNGAHAKSLLRHVLPSSRLGRWGARAITLIPEDLAIPYPAEDLFWILFQRSAEA